jgi:hypothetical protein
MSFVSPGGCVGNIRGAWHDKESPVPPVPETPSTPLTPATLVDVPPDRSTLSESEKTKSAYLTPPDFEMKSRNYAIGNDPVHGVYKRELPLSKGEAKRAKVQKAAKVRGGIKELKLVENGKTSERKMRLFAPVYSGIAAGLSLFFISKGISELCCKLFEKRASEAISFCLQKSC